ncbi:MAG: DUF1848 family protein, partial [Acutalibacteraceae bacterium]|nr:DUF1848 family protein [Acutalibacteraceae bacterium]
MIDRRDFEASFRYAPFGFKILPTAHSFWVFPDCTFLDNSNYFQYTITPYGKDVERNIPNKEEVVIPAFKKIGSDKAIWRYDPIFINEKYTWDYHIRAFTKIAEMLEGYTNKAVMSYVDSYRTVDLSPLHIQPLTIAQQKELAEQLSEIAAAHGITLTACAEDLGLPYSCCIDGKMFGINKPKDRN